MVAATEVHFRVGQVAKKFGVSTYHIRKLLEAGLMDGELTDGQQWRIPTSEIARFEKSGLPPTPQTAGRDTEAGHRLPPPPAGSRQGHPALLAPPSDEVIEAAEEVVVLENEVKALGLRRQREEGLDWFREREEQEAERLAAEQDTERQAQAQAERDRRRRRWFDDWQRYSLDSFPREARNQVEKGVYEAVTQVLGELEPEQDSGITRRLVDAAVERALAPWRTRKEIEQAIEDAVNRLPSGARSYFKPTAWQIQATQAARQAIRQLEPDASFPEIEAAARQAVELIAREFEAHKAAQQDAAMRQDILRWASLPAGLTEEGRELASRAVAEAVAALPPATPRRKLEEAAEQAVAPFREAVARYQQEQAQAQQEQAERERQERQAESQRRDKERLIETALGEVFGYLLKLEQDWDFDGKTAWTLEREIKEPIRKRLDAELAGNEPLDQVQKRVRRLVREQLGITAGPTTQQRAEAHPRQVGEGRTVRTGARV